jgi:hypothetical protein
MRGRDFTVSAMVSKKAFILINTGGQYYQTFILFFLNVMYWTWPNIEIIDCKVILSVISYAQSEQILMYKIKSFLFSF